MTMWKPVNERGIASGVNYLQNQSGVGQRQGASGQRRPKNGRTAEGPRAELRPAEVRQQEVRQQEVRQQEVRQQEVTRAEAWSRELKRRCSVVD
jgi:hypothetical protein